MINGRFFLIAFLLTAVVFTGTSLYSQDILGSWQFTSSMITPRFEASAVSAGDYVYVMGGHGEYNGEPFATVERAYIREDGTLGKWILEEEELAYPVYAAGAVAKNGFIYVIGGYPYPGEPVGVVQYAQVNPDGTLGSWQYASTLQQSRASIAVAEYDGYIYAMGGVPGRALSSVEYAAINGDGTLSAWAYTSSNIAAREEPSARAYDGYLYLVGGYQHNTVEMAQINANGTLGTWEYTEPLNSNRSGTPGIAVIDSYMYVIAGNSTIRNPENTIERAYINSGGDLEPWAVLPDTLLDRINLSACVQDGLNVYLIGGQTISGLVVDDVEMNYSFETGTACGDVNCDDYVNVSDAVKIINYIFIGGSAPCDSNGDGDPDC